MLDQAPGWTDQRVAKLKDLWMRGFSASQIADELGGTTRNAVLGKLSRMGLLNSNPNTSKPKPRAKRSEPVAVNRRSTQSAPRGDLHAEPDAAGMELLKQDLWVKPASDEPVTLLDRNMTSQCAWPIGDPLTPEFRMCGAPQVEGSSYCSSHKRASVK